MKDSYEVILAKIHQIHRHITAIKSSSFKVSKALDKSVKIAPPKHYLNFFSNFQKAQVKLVVYYNLSGIHTNMEINGFEYNGSVVIP